MNLSAMAQGHALSVLTRAYFLTKNPIYIKNAKNALKIFKIVSFIIILLVFCRMPLKMELLINYLDIHGMKSIQPLLER